MKQRKGFTLIELMIVIAIIIILAAIAIPNYLRMTERARRSRVAGDFTSVATALEAYAVDWGTYPVDVAEEWGKNIDGTTITSHIALELTGTTGATTNISANTTVTGEKGGISYINAGTIQAMYDPFIPANGYWYVSSASGNHWVLEVAYDAATVLYRSDMTTDLTEFGTHHGDAATVAGATLAVTDAGAITP